MDELGDRYALGAVLGTGGMGTVYSATQRSLGRKVAIKFPHAHLVGNPVVVRRFHAEALAGGRLDHRNIARVIEYGDRDGVSYLVMEHVEGTGLDRLVAEQGPLEVRRVVDLCGQVLAGLDAVHRAGIVHADIKSANVLVESRADGTQIARLIDFGLARFSNEPSLDDDRVLSGTPEYVAPELIETGSPMVTSDIYAVGVVMYELLTGSTPFGGGTSDEILRRQIDDAVVPPSLRAPERDIPIEIEAVVMRALAKDPRARFPTAASFAEALRIKWRTAMPRLARGTEPAAFSTQTTRTSEPLAQTAEVADNRLIVAKALVGGDTDTIITAYLDLVRALVDDCKLATAVDELTYGLAFLRTELSPSEPPPAIWRLQLCLAALYSGIGDKARAREAAGVGRDDATRASCTLGQIRANELLERLSRNGKLTRKL
ncbi:MAG: serine/threonine protein kinase [Myxococcota bacterium]|nr:serine/threonine protein kinase [Myxococcota bacterium]